MNLFELLVTLVQSLLVFVGLMVALLVALLVASARLPADHPFIRILYAVSLRLGATVGAGIAAIGVEPIPGLDVAVPAALIYFWVTLFREVAAILRDTRRPAAAPVRIEQQGPTKTAGQTTAPGGPLSERGGKVPPRLPR